MRNADAAQDIVQDAMVRLSEKYGDRTPDELPMLFQRILQNAIRDYYRRAKVRSTWFTLFSSLTGKGEEPVDFLETYTGEQDAGAFGNPESQYSQAQMVALIETELEALPARQREAFIMRYWLGMDIEETSSAMGCTEGSVKTHCSRATHTLAAALRAKGVTL